MTLPPPLPARASSGHPAPSGEGRCVVEASNRRNVALLEGAGPCSARAGNGLLKRFGRILDQALLGARGMWSKTLPLLRDTGRAGRLPR